MTAMVPETIAELTASSYFDPTDCANAVRLLAGDNVGDGGLAEERVDALDALEDLDALDARLD